MTVTSGNSLAGIGPPPVRSSSVPGGRSPGAAEDGEGRHDALAKGRPPRRAGPEPAVSVVAAPPEAEPAPPHTAPETKA